MVIFSSGMAAVRVRVYTSVAAAATSSASAHIARAAARRRAVIVGGLNRYSSRDHGGAVGAGAVARCCASLLIRRVRVRPDADKPLNVERAGSRQSPYRDVALLPCD